MATALILVGVGCLIAAIVGGGVKFHNLEVGSVKSLWRQLLLGGFGAMLIASGAALWNGLSFNGGAGGAGNSAAGAEAGDPDIAAPDTNPAGSDRDNVAPIDRAASGPGAAPSGGSATGAPRPLVFANQCPEPIRIWVAYQADGAWHDNGGEVWTIGPGYTDAIGRGGRPLRPTSDEMYFYAVSVSGRREWKGTVDFRSIRNMVRANIDSSGGNYVLRLLCD